MRKKDIQVLSAIETSQSASKDEDMKNHIAAFEEKLRENKEKLKQGKQKYEKMIKFMISKFLDFQNIVCPPDKDGDPTHDDIADL